MEEPSLKLTSKMKELGDVTLVSEGQAFITSKAMLASRSCYFSCMFNRFGEENQDEVNISIPPAFLDLILTYLTEGEIKLDSLGVDSTAKLLVHADFLMLEHL